MSDEVAASEVVRALTAAVLKSVAQDINTLSAMALRDAHLDPAEGWRYDVERMVYVKQ